MNLEWLNLFTTTKVGCQKLRRNFRPQNYATLTKVFATNASHFNEKNIVPRKESSLLDDSRMLTHFHCSRLVSDQRISAFQNLISKLKIFEPSQSTDKSLDDSQRGDRTHGARMSISDINFGGSCIVSSKPETSFCTPPFCSSSSNALEARINS